MSKVVTIAYNCCPRCMSEHIEATRSMYGEKEWAVEHLTCNDCGLEFEQHYRYVVTVGEWDDEEEA